MDEELCLVLAYYSSPVIPCRFVTKRKQSFFLPELIFNFNLAFHTCLSKSGKKIKKKDAEVAKIIDKKLLVKDRIAQEFGQAYNLFFALYHRNDAWRLTRL